MKSLAKVFVGITALLHVLFFKIESIDFMKPEILARFGLDLETGQIAKVWAFNQGFYNLFLALGLIFGLVQWQRGRFREVKVMIATIQLSLFGAGLVLILSAPHKYVAAGIQGLPALLGFVFILAYKFEES